MFLWGVGKIDGSTTDREGGYRVRTIEKNRQVGRGTLNFSPQLTDVE